VEVLDYIILPCSNRLESFFAAVISSLIMALDKLSSQLVHWREVYDIINDSTPWVLVM